MKQIWQKMCEFIRKILLEQQRQTKEFNQITIVKHRLLKVGNNYPVEYSELLHSLNMDEG
jgi:hypothetical protein